MIAVHAPQVPRSQTRFAPVRFNWLRMASISVVRGSTVKGTGLPLILSEMDTADGPTALPAALAASAGVSRMPVERSPPAREAPLINPRRENADFAALLSLLFGVGGESGGLFTVNLPFVS